jgi:hypothetical protein
MEFLRETRTRELFSLSTLLKPDERRPSAFWLKAH